MKLWIPATFIFVGLATLITLGVLQGAIPEIPVRDLYAAEADFAGKKIKLQGVIKEIHKNTRPLEFVICDRENPELVVLAVVDETRPDIFDVEKDVAVEGIFDPAGKKILGTKIYTKCPSKYEASEGKTPETASSSSKSDS